MDQAGGRASCCFKSGQVSERSVIISVKWEEFVFRHHRDGPFSRCNADIKKVSHTLVQITVSESVQFSSRCISSMT